MAFTVTANRSTVSDNAPSVAVPAGGAPGAVYLLVLYFMGTDTVTWPEGFTDIGVTSYDPNVSQYTKAAVRAYDGNEPTSFSGSTATYQRWEARCVLVPGVQATPDDVSANSTYHYSDTADLAGAEITTTGPNRTILWLAGTAAGGGAAVTGTLIPPSGFTVDDEIDRGNGGFTGIAHATQADAGSATYSGSATFDGVADSRGSNILVVAFAPAGPVDTGELPGVELGASPAGSAALSTSVSLSATSTAAPMMSATGMVTGVLLSAVIGLNPSGQAPLTTAMPLSGSSGAAPGAQSSMSTNLLLSAQLHATPDGAALLVTVAAGLAATIAPSPAATGALATQILMSVSGSVSPGGEAALAVSAGAMSATLGARPGGQAGLTTSIALAAAIIGSPAMKAALSAGALAGVPEEQILAIVQAELEKPGGVMELLLYLQTKLDAIS